MSLMERDENAPTERVKFQSWFDAHRVKHGHHGVDNDTLVKNYDTLADKYDEFFLSPEMKAAGYQKIPEELTRLFPTGREKVRLLDCGAGTGNVGQNCRDSGFTLQDALEPSACMLDVARAKGIYQEHFCMFLDDKPLDIPSDRYDAVYMQGVIGPGTVPVVAFNELLRIVKPGGYIIMTNRAAYLDDVIPDFRDNFRPFIADLEKKGKWKLETEERYPNQFMDHEGIMMIFSRCKAAL